MSSTRPGEFDLIKRFFAPLAKDPGSMGLTDDAAVLTARDGFDLVLTKDVLAADVHFFANDPADAIAAKALRVNLSDLASKGARPRGYLLGLALPETWTEDWLARFCTGLARDQETYEIVLLGGDTIRSGNGLQVSITAIGEVEKGRAVRRSGAQPGDVLFLSGTIGDAAAGLKVRLDPDYGTGLGLPDPESEHILDRYLLPRPRTSLAECLTGHANAAMDVSDGLFADALHMARASQVELKIDLESLPLSATLSRIKARNQFEFLTCVNGGDDYEILVSVQAGKADAFQGAALEKSCPVTRIGLVESGEGSVSIQQGGQPVDLGKLAGFRHF